MRLQSNDDVVLRPGFGRVLNAARMSDPLFSVDQQFDAIFLHGLEMRAPGDQRDILTGE